MQALGWTNGWWSGEGLLLAMSWSCQGEYWDSKAITDMAVVLRGSSCHLGVAESSYIQAGIRVAIGSPEQSLDGGREGGPCARNEVQQRTGRESWGPGVTHRWGLLSRQSLSLVVLLSSFLSSTVEVSLQVPGTILVLLYSSKLNII